MIKLFSLFDCRKRILLMVVAGTLFATAAKSASTADSVRIRHVDQDYLSLEEMLKGRIPGVAVSSTDGSPGAMFNIIVRGLKSFRGANQPLIVLDGVALNPQNQDVQKTFWYDQSDYQMLQNSLFMINPDDVAKVEVLKNSTELAIYGAEGGAGGVILITTKNPGGQTAVKFTTRLGLSTMGSPRKDMLNPEQYKNYISQTNPFSAILSSDLTPVDWQKKAERVGVSNSQFLSVSGSSKMMKYYMSGWYNNQQGIIDRSDASTASFRINLDGRLTPLTRVGSTILLAYNQTDMVQATTPTNGLGNIRLMSLGRPYLYDADFSDPAQAELYGEENYLGWKNDYDDISSEWRIVPMVFFETRLVKGLNWKTSASFDYRNKTRTRWFGLGIEKGYDQNSIAGRSVLYAFKYDFDTHLAADLLLGGKHALTAQAGVKFYGRNQQDRTTEGYDFIFQSMRGTGVANAQKFPPGESTTPTYNFIQLPEVDMAAYATATYSWAKRYEVDATLRVDGISHYDTWGSPNVWPAVGAKWNINNEPFFKPVLKTVSKLTLRAGWGISGSHSLEPYRNIYNYTTPTSGFPYPTFAPGLSALSYNTLWRLSNRQFDAGVDATMLGGRLSVSLGYYNSMSSDDLRVKVKTGADYSDVDGALSQGKVRNRGFEMAVDGIVYTSKDIKWTASVNLAFNRNRIVDTGAAGNYAGNSVGINAAGADYYANAVWQGYSVGAFYGFETAGLVNAANNAYVPSVNGTRLVPGDIMLIDQNGDGRITDADMKVIGNPNPKVTGGLQTSLSYRRWGFDLSLDGMAGNQVLNLNLLAENNFTSGNTLNISQKAFYDSWSIINPTGKYPRMDGVGIDMITDRMVQDGSFLRLSELRATYDLPLKAKWIQGLQFSLSVHNLFVLTRYGGYDPEVNGYGDDPLRWGVDCGSYPKARTFLLGVSANF